MATAALLPSQPRSARLQATVTLALFALAVAFFLAVSLSPLAEGFADAEDRGPGDLGLYSAEVARIHSGESYYDAAAAELIARGYPTQSVFNWRTPLPVLLIATLPEPLVANVLLVAVSLALVVLSFALLADEGGPLQGFAGVLLLSGALLPCFLGEPVLLSELWAGVLIALSAVCFARNRCNTGVLIGLAALFFRELAALYVLVCLALAVHQRRHRELGLWSLGLVAYAIFYAWHLGQVIPRIPAGAHAHGDGWLRLGGAGFLISTAQMNAYLLLLPQWVAAVFLAMALLGAATWNSPGGRLIGYTIAAYTAAFAIVGNDFNQYWGCLTAPLFCLSAARAPFVLRDLWNVAARSASNAKALPT
jgi:hypothetical protein